jgi:hypothetical protein
MKKPSEEEKKIKKLSKEKDKLEIKLKESESRCKELEDSTSYKLGRKLTYIPGKIKRKIKGGK